MLLVDAIGRHSVDENDILALNKRGYFDHVPFEFRRPGWKLAVEVMGAGFDKPANVRYFTVWFPRVQKTHDDRTFKDTISFQEAPEFDTVKAGKVSTDNTSKVEGIVGF